MKSARQTVTILVLALLLSAAWSLALRVLPRPALAETNYEANRLRIENWLLGPPAPAVIVGTSLAGRLLPSYFAGSALAGTANLGLDGASPVTGLTLSLLREPAPKLVFLEVHLLSKPPGANDKQLLELATGVGLQISRVVPLTRADSRPSTVLYGWLKERQGGGNAPPGEGTDRVRRSTTDTTVVQEPIEKSAASIDSGWEQRLQALLRRLKQQGSQVVLIRLPAGRMNPEDPDTPDEADLVAAELGLPLMDLLRLSRQQGISIGYTDGLHLTPPSARAVSQLLVKAVGKLKATNGKE